MYHPLAKIFFFYMKFANIWYIACFVPKLILYSHSIPWTIFSEWQIQKYHVAHRNYSPVFVEGIKTTILATQELEEELNLVIILDESSYIQEIIPKTKKKL